MKIKIHLILISLIILINLSAFNSSHAQVVTQLSFFAPLPSIFEMKYSDNHLFITQQGLKVMDVSDPNDPVIVGSANYFNSYAYQIAVDGDQVYMAEGGNGAFAVYDISNVSNPVMTGFVNIPATTFLTGGDLVADGDYVYMTGFDTLYVINVSDPSDPQVQTTLALSDALFSGAGEMEIDGDVLYIKSASSFQVFDISDPAVPAFLNSVMNTHLSEKGLSIDTAGNRLFIPWVSTLQEFMGYDAYDISISATPVFLFSDSTEFGSGDFGISAYWNNLLYLSKGGGINIFNVTNNNHEFLTSFTGQDVANSSVAIEVRDSIFYNARISGVEILKLNSGIPTAISDNVVSSPRLMEIYPSLIDKNNSELNLVSYETFVDASLQIFSSKGERIYSLNHLKMRAGQSEKISLKTLPEGFYFVQVNDQLHHFTGKFIVE